MPRPSQSLPSQYHESQFRLGVEVDGSVHQHPAHEAADLLHAGELGPLVGVGVVALHAAQDRLVLAEPAANVDPPLVSNNRTTEARYRQFIIICSESGDYC